MSKHRHKKEHEKKEHEKKEHYKKGGAVHEEGGDVPLKRGGKTAHKAEGKKPKHRLDRARGGRTMTPKSPLSGAAPSKQRPGFSEKQSIGKQDN